MAPRLSWSWGEAARGAASVLPGVALIAAGFVDVGVAAAMGVLPAAMAGVAARRRDRVRLVVVGCEFAVAYALGSVVGVLPVLAIASLMAASFLSVKAAGRHSAARLLPVLVVPAFALGMNESPLTGVLVAVLFVAGSAWTAFVAWCWPTAGVAASTPSPSPAMPAAYALAYSVAAGVGLALGFAFHRSHVAWIAAAAMFISRPAVSMLRARALQRTLATCAGVLLAGVVAAVDLSDAALAMLTGVALAAMVASRRSGWYVAPAATALVVVLVSGLDDSSQFRVAVVDRLVETGIGAALALLVVATTARRAPVVRPA